MAIKKLTKEQMAKRRKKVVTPLQKVDDVPSVNDIIKNDAMLVRVAFISSLMVRGCTIEQMRAQYNEHFGESVSASKITQLRNSARMVYLSQIARNRDESVAEELMKADWEAQELMNAWDRSKEESKKKIKHTANSSGSEMMTYDLDEETTQTENNFGDVRYLEQLGKVRQRVINVLGLEAPKQATQTNTTMPAVTINVVESKPKIIQVEDTKPEQDDQPTE